MNATRSEVPPETEGALITADLRRALEPRLNAELLDDFGFTGVDIATTDRNQPALGAALEAGWGADAVRVAERFAELPLHRGRATATSPRTHI